ncbi:uncharacterized protein C2orf81 homolog isoform X2 [Anas acuta]|uniref:uncharacterized protein C2orf81 homolog isoform X2 n=1 Tax=Anas acuta TaxID=28680 RepID=UPI0035C90CD7
MCWGYWDCWEALGCTGGTGECDGCVGASPGGAGRQGGAPSPAGLLLGAAGSMATGLAVSVQGMASRERTAASRLRGDKSRPSTATAVPTDIVPGRLSEAQWLALLAAEEGDEDVGDVLAELLGRVLEECFQLYLARQRVPFTVSQARDAVLQVAEWRFQARDEGDAELEGGAWQEDEEPQPCAIDAWAQGSVPILQEHPSPRPGDREVSSTDTVLAEAECASSAPRGVPAPSHAPLPQDGALTAPQPPGGRSSSSPSPAPRPAPQPAPLRPAAARPRRQPRHQPQPLPGLESPELLAQREAGSSVEVSVDGLLLPLSCRPLVKIQTGRPPCSKARVCGKPSTTLGTSRLDPSRRWIRPQVEVLDPGEEAKWQPCPPATRRHSREPRSPSVRHKGPGSSLPPLGLAAAGGAQLLPPAPGARQPSSPQPPELGSLLDAVRLAPGVTIRRGEGERHGLCRPAHHEEEEEEEMGEARRDLRPLRPAVPFPTVSVSQVTGYGPH